MISVPLPSISNEMVWQDPYLFDYFENNIERCAEKQHIIRGGMARNMSKQKTGATLAILGGDHW
jgi:hypothetical protein